MRRFQNDFERDRVHPRRGSQNAIVMVVNDAVAGGKTIYNGIDVARQDFAGFLESGPEEVFGQCMAANETVNSLTGVVSMKLNDPAEMIRAEFVFENLHLGFDR